MLFGRPDPQVLVAGAGPVGLFAALSLARRGIRVRLIDEEWRPATHSYALALHPKSLELLDALDLAQGVLKNARTIESIGLYDRSGRHAGMKLDALGSKYPFVAVLPQADFEGQLTAALEKAGVKAEWNHRLARIDPSGDHVDVTVETLSKSSTGYAAAHIETVVEDAKKHHVPFVIGADGHSSLVRTQLKIPFDSVKPADEFAVFEFEAAGELPDEMCVVLNEDDTNVLWPMTQNRYRWSFQSKGEVAGSHSREKDRLLLPLGSPSVRELDPDQLERLIAERAPWFKARVGEVIWRLGVRFEYRMASSFAKGHACLAGDAGHMTGPVGIQSMNVGLAEVAELTDVVAGVLAGKQQVDSLARYSSQRVGEWTRLLNVGGPGLVVTNDADAWIKARVERLTMCIPASGNHYEKLATQLGLKLRQD